MGIYLEFDLKYRGMVEICVVLVLEVEFLGFVFLLEFHTLEFKNIVLPESVWL